MLRSVRDKKTSLYRSKGSKDSSRFLRLYTDKYISRTSLLLMILSDFSQELLEGLASQDEFLV